MLTLRPWVEPTATPALRSLLVRALPLDRIDVVLEEKLFGENGARTSRLIVAFEGDRLVGLLASADRFIKILAVDPDHRRRGIGTALLAEHGAYAQPIRVGDHPGNYLSPGIDVGYTEGIAFLRARGFTERERVENLRVPYEDNPLVSPARAERLLRDAAGRGHRIARPNEAERQRLLAMIDREFAPVWAHEAARAGAGPRGALFAAFATDGEPIAFAAADGNNQGLGWFGPAGTLPQHRGKKLGEALLLQCLLAVRGLPEAGVIAWIGPKPFYERAVGARADRQFVQMSRTP